MRIASLLVLAFVISPTKAAVPISAPLPQSCPETGDVPASFATSISASSFRTHEGKEIRLAGVIGPGEDGQDFSSRDVEAARAALAKFVSGQPLLLAIRAEPDRYQRVTAEVFVNGEWVQDAMLRQGLLRVAPELSAGSCLTMLLNAEQEAASKSAGHWSDGSFRIRTPDQLTGRKGNFEIVEGEVWRIRFTRGKNVIEFANASSFELTVSTQVARILRQNDIDVRRLRGQVLRVRGWIALDERPEMELLQPGALQLIGKPVRRR